MWRTESGGCEAREVGEGQVMKVLGFYTVDSFTGVSGGDTFIIILVNLWNMGL